MRTFQKALAPEHIRLEQSEAGVGASAAILPGLGANLVSFEVDGVEFIYWNESAWITDETFSGAFNMFPAPCRLAGCSYTFEGRHVTQRKHGKDVFIHGLLRDESMQSNNEGNRIVSRLEIEPDHPVFEGFPYRCVFSVCHELERGRGCDNSAVLTVGFEVENRDRCNIPFGYGIHPYWRIHGTRKDILLRVPCDHVMDSKDLVPTGGISPVARTDNDLRVFKSIDNLFIDKVYYRLQSHDTAEILFRALKKRILIESSPEFTHAIVYTPVEKLFFCVEHLTSCPNAQNLVSEAAHMFVLPPGRKAAGWIRYTVSTMEELNR